MPSDLEAWYDPEPDLTAPYQGDVYDGIPIVVMPPASGTWVLLRPTQPVTSREALAGKTPPAFKPHSEVNLVDAWSDNEEFVLARGVRRRVLVTTQTCDIENRNFVHVAPVAKVNDQSPKKQESIRLNEVRYAFYLPPDEFADLSQAALIHKSYRETWCLGSPPHLVGDNRTPSPPLWNAGQILWVPAGGQDSAVG